LYFLEFYPGLAPFVEMELGWRGLAPGQGYGANWLSVDLRESGIESRRRLGEMRTVLSTYELLRIEETEGVEVNADMAHEVFGAFNPQGSAPPGGWSFRLSLPKMQSRSRYNKTVTLLARELAESRMWKNNPSNYVLDLKVAAIDKHIAYLWRDTRWESGRRREDRWVIPASIHPTVGAALCFLGEIHPDDVVCDPCCGAGTILVERLSIGPARQILGMDPSAAAIEASSNNLARYDDARLLSRADMANLPLARKSVNLLIANLPFGIRLGRREKNLALYSRFLAEASRVLAGGGRLVAYTHDRQAFRKASAKTGWKDMAEEASIQAGGLSISVYKGVNM
jgi:predicted RNA methylase